MGNSLVSWIFIKSAVHLTSLKFGLMITWVNTIVKKYIFVAIATTVDFQPQLCKDSYLFSFYQMPTIPVMGTMGAFP